MSGPLPDLFGGQVEGEVEQVSMLGRIGSGVSRDQARALAGQGIDAKELAARASGEVVAGSDDAGQVEALAATCPRCSEPTDWGLCDGCVAEDKQRRLAAPSDPWRCVHCGARKGHDGHSEFLCGKGASR